MARKSRPARVPGKKTPLQRAIEAAGGPKTVGRAFDITPEAVYQWERCPVPRVLELERISGVPRHELRPDIYPPPKGG